MYMSLVVVVCFVSVACISQDNNLGYISYSPYSTPLAAFG